MPTACVPHSHTGVWITPHSSISSFLVSSPAPLTVSTPGVGRQPRRHDHRHAGGLAARRLGVADEHARHVGDRVSGAGREEAHRAADIAPAGHARRQAVRWSGDVAPVVRRSSGSVTRQVSCAIGQRG